MRDARARATHALEAVGLLAVLPAAVRDARVRATLRALAAVRHLAALPAAAVRVARRARALTPCEGRAARLSTHVIHTLRFRAGIRSVSVSVEPDVLVCGSGLSSSHTTQSRSSSLLETLTSAVEVVPSTESFRFGALLMHSSTSSLFLKIGSSLALCAIEASRNACSASQGAAASIDRRTRTPAN